MSPFEARKNVALPMSRLDPSLPRIPDSTIVDALMNYQDSDQCMVRRMTCLS